MSVLRPMWRLLCLFGRHSRDRNRIRLDGSLYVSPCRGCARRMVKRRHGWRLERSAPRDWQRRLG